MIAAGVDSDDTKNDILLAEMLQHEFDKEFDQQLQRKENKLNGTSKGQCPAHCYMACLCSTGILPIYHIMTVVFIEYACVKVLTRH